MKKPYGIKVETTYGIAELYLEANTDRGIEVQVDEALADIGWCDAYTVVGWEELPSEHVAERERVTAECLEAYGENFLLELMGEYTPLSLILAEIDWREGSE